MSHKREEMKYILYILTSYDIYINWAIVCDQISKTTQAGSNDAIRLRHKLISGVYYLQHIEFII